MSAVLAFDGCYDARRTAALSGVPQSAVYRWARKGIVVPSASPRREKFWSYADLITLRIVSWLRQSKRLAGDVQLESAMRHVRETLVQLDELRLDLWNGSADATLYVGATGQIVIVTAQAAHAVRVQGAVVDWLDVLGSFEGTGGTGPDLREPREHLRIVPGKCAGEPHLDGSRLTTLTVAALASRGYSLDDLVRLYPDESRVSLVEAIDLERSLGTLIPAACCPKNCAVERLEMRHH